MQIVIDIPEKVYGILKYFESAFDGFEPSDVKGALIMATMQGKILPKGHGRLIDADKLKLTRHDIHVEEIDYYHRCVSIENIDEAPTIIEADKAESEEKE